MKECPARLRGEKSVNALSTGANDSPGAVPGLPGGGTMNMGCLESGWTRVKKGPTRFSNMSCQGCHKGLCPVHRTKSNSGPHGQTPPPGKRWEAIDITVDSGACDHVIPPNVIPGPITPTEASRSKVQYYGASGDPITNYGSQELQAYTDSGVQFQMKFNVAGVSKPLGSVGRMCAAGNQVKFGEQGGYIMGPDGKTQVPLTMEDGTYHLRLWMLVPDGPGQVCGLSGNRFSALSDEQDELDMEAQGFQRHV